jgi:hypothetical protein
MKNETLELGQHLDIIAWLKTSGFQKMPVMNPPSTCSSANSKKVSYMDCQFPTPTSQNSPFFVNISAD